MGTLVVACSGGRDSVVLLHLLRFALPGVAPRLIAAHFDHRMWAGSGAEAAWLRGVCTAWSVPLVSGVAGEALVSEAAARSARYAFLADVAGEVDAGAVLTAHHADDQAETVLFRLARGAGLRGAAGIPVRRGLLRRPLLEIPGVDLAAYARRHGVRWCTDPSNQDLNFARNRIRHAVLPQLETARPGATAALAAFAAHAGAAETVLEGRARRAFRRALEARSEGVVELARPVLLGYDPDLRARVLRRALRSVGARAGSAGTRVAVEFISGGATGARVSVGTGAEVERAWDRIVVRAAHRPHAADRLLQVGGAAEGAGKALVGGRTWTVGWGVGEAPGMKPVDTAPGASAEATGALCAASFALPALRFPLEIRPWRPGDRVALEFGRKKVKKLFAEHRIRRADRGSVPVVVDAAGELLWIVGVARSIHAVAGTGPAFFLTVRHVEHD